MSYKKYSWITLLSSFALLLSSCGNNSLPYSGEDNDPDDIDTPWVDYSTPATSIDFEDGQDNKVLNKNETYQYKYTIYPEKATEAALKWSTSDARIVSVSKGLITANNPGTAVITVESVDKTFKSKDFVVTVISPLESYELTSEENVSLGYHKTSQITLAFTPEDTTQSQVTYTSSNTIVATVSDEGLITTNAIDGDTDITIHSEYNNIDKVVHVHVSEVHVESITIQNKSTNEVELGKKLQLFAQVLPDNAYDKSFTWSLAEEDANKATISENGLISTLATGVITASATCIDRPDVKDTLQITIYENIADKLVVNSQEVTISNKDPEFQLVTTYEKNGVEMVPTINELSYSIKSGNEYITLSESGLITYVKSGTAVVTVSDPHVEGVNSVDVTVTCETLVKSVTLTGTVNDLHIGESLELSFSTNPAYEDLDAHNPSIAIDDPTIISATLNGNVITVTALAIGQTNIKMVVNGVESNSLRINVKHYEFEADKVYLVGNRNYTTKVGTEGTSWNDPSQAFKFVKTTTNEYADFEYYDTFHFSIGDQWIVKHGNHDTHEAEMDETDSYQIGKYKTNEAAFKDNQMAFNKNGKVEVLVEGYYDIYYAYYTNEHNEGWYEVYVARHSITVDKTALTIKAGTTDSFSISNYNGALSATSEDTDVATVSVVDNVATVNGVAEGDTRIVVKDDENIPVYVSITVYENDLPEFDANKYYITGSKTYSGKVSSEGASWANPEKAYTFTDADLNDNAYAKFEYHVTIKFDAGDQWIVQHGENRILETAQGEGDYSIGRYKTNEAAFANEQMEFVGDDTIEVLVAGYYDIYYAFYKNEHPEGWYEVYVAKHEIHTSVTSVNVKVGETATFEVHDWNGDISISSVDPEVAGWTRDGNVVTVNGIAEGTTKIMLSDIEEKPIYVDVNVYTETPPEPTLYEYTITGNPGWLSDLDAVIFAWVWGGNYGGGQWVACTLDGTTIKLELDGTATGLKCGRFPNGTTSPTWDTAWNQMAGDVTLSSGTYTYVTPGW